SEWPMLRRVSANFLLQSVIAVVGIALVAALASDAFDAWRAVGTASRLKGIAEVAGHAFRAMHNLRIDRSFTVRALAVEWCSRRRHARHGLEGTRRGAACARVDHCGAAHDRDAEP